MAGNFVTGFNFSNLSNLAHDVKIKAGVKGIEVIIHSCTHCTVYKKQTL